MPDHPGQQASERERAAEMLLDIPWIKGLHKRDAKELEYAIAAALTDARRQALKEAARLIEQTFSQHFAAAPKGTEDWGRIRAISEHPGWWVILAPTPFEPNATRKVEMDGRGCPACMAEETAAAIRSLPAPE